MHKPLKSLRELPPFVRSELVAQTAFFRSHFPGQLGSEGDPYRLKVQHTALNLAPPIRAAATSFLKGADGRWLRHANHALSPRACLLNFLYPLRQAPERLERIIARALRLRSISIVPVGGDSAGAPVFLHFGRSSPAHRDGDAALPCPCGRSPDAVVRIRGRSGDELLFIVWAYTEFYSSLSQADLAGSAKLGADPRLAIGGPFRDDIGLRRDDLERGPIHRLAELQFEAAMLERQPGSAFSRVRLLHLAPRHNTPLRERSADRFATPGDIFELYRSFLHQPDRFESATIEDAIGPELALSDDWARYLRHRYGFLSETARI